MKFIFFLQNRSNKNSILKLASMSITMVLVLVSCSEEEFITVSPMTHEAIHAQTENFSKTEVVGIPLPDDWVATNNAPFTLIESIEQTQLQSSGHSFVINFMMESPVKGDLLVFSIESEVSETFFLQVFDEEGYEIKAGDWFLMFDEEGYSVATTKFKVPVGQSYYALNIKNFENGTYYLQISNDDREKLIRPFTISKP